MKERKIFITFEAIYDIADAEEYILYAFGEKRAEEYQHAIYEELYKLKSDIVSYMPSGFKYRKYTIKDKSVQDGIIDSFAHMPAMNGRRSARYFCRYSGNIVQRYFLHNKKPFKPAIIFLDY